MEMREGAHLKHLKLQCLIVRDMFNGRKMKLEHNCCRLFGKAMVITYLKVNEQHLECLFYCFVVSPYFINGVANLGISKQARSILLLK